MNSQEIWANCLSGEQVNDIAITESSYWIASSGGLVHYNKITNKNTYYNRANSPLASNHIQSVVLDKHNVLWMMTPTGLYSYDDQEWTNYSQLQGQITLDEKDNIVVANTQEINIWNGQIFNSISLFDSLKYLIISDVVINKLNGDIWISAYTFGQFEVTL